MPHDADFFKDNGCNIGNDNNAKNVRQITPSVTKTHAHPDKKIKRRTMLCKPLTKETNKLVPQLCQDLPKVIALIKSQN
jgi:hypothetical protein